MDGLWTSPVVPGPILAIPDLVMLVDLMVTVGSQPCIAAEAWQSGVLQELYLELFGKPEGAKALCMYSTPLSSLSLSSLATVTFQERPHP